MASGYEDESSLFPESPPASASTIGDITGSVHSPYTREDIPPSSTAPLAADLGFISGSTTPLFPDDFDSGSAFLTESISRSTATRADSHSGMTSTLANSMSGYAEESENTWEYGHEAFAGHDYMAVDATAESTETAEPEASESREQPEEVAQRVQSSTSNYGAPPDDDRPEKDSRPKLWDTDDDDIPDEPDVPETEDEPVRSSTEAPSTISTTASTAPPSAPTQAQSKSQPQQSQQSRAHAPQTPQAPRNSVVYNPQSYYKQEPAMSYNAQPYYNNQPAQMHPGRAPPPPTKTITEYVLRTKVTGMERSGKKPPLIRFDAYTNLPRFRTTQFRDIRRTYSEFLKLFKHLSTANPECFVPTVPLDTTFAGPGTDEDEYRIKVNFQKWLDRVTSNQVLMRDEEMMYFIESDFGYSPMTKRKAPATGLRRKAIKQLAAPPDDCQELVEFRPLAKRFYLMSDDVRTRLEKVSKIRKTLGMAEIELGHRFTNMTALEFQSGMINMWKKLGKTVMSVGDIQGIKTTAEMATLGDGLLWLSNDAYVVKETLTNRQILIRDLLSAQSTSRSRHATAARLRSSATINPLRVDEALNSLEDAKQIEAALTAKVNRVTNNLTKEKNEWLASTDEDLQGYIADYVRRMIDAERRTLAVWESIRLDIRTADGSGGLSRLGRSELPAIVRRAGVVSSQGPKGDSWSGDRRSAHGNNGVFPAMIDDENEEEGILEVDAKNAAAMLAGSTF
ncbi:hypothetical protein V1517DRAFT_313261 [Lipomyces orientalis]|uniref:Uncharacterized protein n=1 Tax=Lipomyces orientalis TaxID=1233043 RepID=A0ACC3TXC8_9ASCO